MQRHIMRISMSHAASFYLKGRGHLLMLAPRMRRPAARRRREQQVGIAQSSIDNSPQARSNIHQLLQAKRPMIPFPFAMASSDPTKAGFSRMMMKKSCSTAGTGRRRSPLLAVSTLVIVMLIAAAPATTRAEELDAGGALHKQAGGRPAGARPAALVAHHKRTACC